MIEKININGVEYAVTPVTEGEAANGVTVKVDGVTYLLGEPIVSPVVAPAASAGSQAIEKVQVNGALYDIADVEGVEAEAQRAQDAEQALGMALQNGLNQEATARDNLAKEIKSNAMQYDTLGVYVRADKAEIYGRSIDTTPRVVEFPAATTEKAGVMSAADKRALDNVDNKINQAIADIVDSAPESFDTLKEVATWIEDDETGAAAMAQAISDNTKTINEEKERSLTADAELINAINEEAERVDNKMAQAKTELVNGDVIVGQSREVYSRTGKSDNATFLKRTTAGGTSIGDGVATLKQIGGNIVKNLGDITTALNYGSVTVVGNIAKLIGVEGTYGEMKQFVNITDGHKYYSSAKILMMKGENCQISINGGYNSVYLREIGKWSLLSILREGETGKSPIIRVAGNGEVCIMDWLLIDLTEMFGVGNEPTKEECDKMFGTMDALPQGLTVANPTTFTSTGFNQFNPESVLEGKAIVDNAIVSGDKKIAVIPCLPCKVGVGENNGYCVHGDFGEDIKVYLTPLNPMEVDGELYMHELTKDATTDTYVPLIKGYMLVEVPTTDNLCAHFLWSEDKCERDSYEPYFESKVELPIIPEMSEWGLAGIGVNGSLVADTIDLDRMVYTKRIGRLKEMDKLNWYKGANGLFYSQQIIGLRNFSNTIITDAGYTQGANADGTITINDYGRLCLWDSSIESVGELKNLLKDKTLYYHLRTVETYPIVTKAAPNYIGSDYGVEQFDSVVPCNANNLYYMRSLAGETRNFLDRLMAGLGTSDATVVADRILAVVNPAVEPANVEPETPIEE